MKKKEEKLNEVIDRLNEVIEAVRTHLNWHQETALKLKKIKEDFEKETSNL